MMEGSYCQCKHFREGATILGQYSFGGVFLTLSLPLALWRDDPASALCCEYPALAYNLCPSDGCSVAPGEAGIFGS